MTNENRVFRSSKLVLTLALTLPWLGFAIPGCAERVPYPEAKVTTPIGRPGQCAQCGKKIENVTEDNTVVIEGVQYVVCDSKCEADLREWLKKLEER